MKKLFPFLFFCMSLAVSAQQVNATQSNCDEEYQVGASFYIDTFKLHPFTINANGGQIIFSSGNLQYQPSTRLWRFALHQYDFVGDATRGNVYAHGVKCNNNLISKFYTGWVDLFGWGTSGFHNQKDEYNKYHHPYSTVVRTVNTTYNLHGYGPSFGVTDIANHIDTNDITGRQYDWGQFNFIREYMWDVDSNRYDSSMYRRGIWRVLTTDEWNYLLSTRVVEGQDSAWCFARIQYTKNEEDTISGLIIYPDDYQYFEAGIPRREFGKFRPNQRYNIDSLTWTYLQDVGCVFIPAVGGRTLNASNAVTYSVADTCVYWTANALDASFAYCLNMFTTTQETNYTNQAFIKETAIYRYRSNGYAVRLVQDLK